jgi:hypothetical protein
MFRAAIGRPAKVRVPFGCWHPATTIGNHFIDHGADWRVAFSTRARCRRVPLAERALGFMARFFDADT